MPVNQTIDKRGGIIYRTVSGSVTMDELLRSFGSVLADVDYRPGMKSLTDMREVEHFAAGHSASGACLSDLTSGC
jgi:hypothetical protein